MSSSFNIKSICCSPISTPWRVVAVRRCTTPNLTGQISSVEKIMTLELHFDRAEDLQNFAFSTGRVLKKISNLPAELVSNRFRIIARFDNLADVFSTLLDSVPSLQDRLSDLVGNLTK